MLVPVDDIKVKKRIRKELGDILSLADSMRRFGQICPIMITKKNILIAGERRLEAAKTLGWRTINVVIAEIPDELTKLEYEAEENMQRKEFTPGEAEDAARKIHRLRNPSLFLRVINAIVRFFKRLFRID
jgi:ParB family chromosome partitioning protein